MQRKLNAGLVCLLALGCSPAADKYRDLKHLEVPPTLPIEHVNGPAATGTESTFGRAEQTAETRDLEKLVMLAGDKDKPVLMLKAGFDRSWELVVKALEQTDIEMTEVKRDDGTIRVRYVADKQDGGRSSLFSMFSSPTDTEYQIKIAKGQRPTEVSARKLVDAEQEQEDAVDTVNANDAASLIRLLQKTIIAYLEK